MTKRNKSDKLARVRPAQISFVHQPGMPDLLEVVPDVVRTGVELVRDYNRRENLRVAYEGHAVEGRERRENARTLVAGYVSMREDMNADMRREYHCAFLETIVLRRGDQ